MQENNIKIAVTQETKPNEKTALRSPPGYCIIQENKSKEKGKGVGIAFIIEDKILFRK